MIQPWTASLIKHKEEQFKKQLTPLEMTPEERDKLIDNYAWRVVDDMDIKDLCRIVADMVAHDFETESDEYVIEQVKEYYPDLLDD